MLRNHAALPRLWFFTDDRLTLETLAVVCRALPRGSGVVLRSRDSARMLAMLRIARPLARAGRIVPVISGVAATPGIGRHLGRNGRGLRAPGLTTASAHAVPELRRAERAGAMLVFVSPVFATRSHPGARTLGPLRLATLVRASRLPVVALGGMTHRNWRRVRATGAHGWAAIDGLVQG